MELSLGIDNLPKGDAVFGDHQRGSSAIARLGIQYFSICNDPRCLQRAISTATTLKKR